MPVAAYAYIVGSRSVRRFMTTGPTRTTILTLILNLGFLIYSSRMSLAAVILSLIRHGPNILLYPGAFEPYPRELYRPLQFGLPYEDVKLTTSDNVVLHAYLLMQENTSEDKCLNNGKGLNAGANKEYSRESSDVSCRPTVLMFHGNADNIGYTIPLAWEFYTKLKCNVLLLSPRGYGLSCGRPSTKGFKRDSEAALNYICSHPQLLNSPVILYGQSMGGAFAIDLASRHFDKIDAIILENTFTSLRRLIPEAAPIFSIFAPFFRQWNSISRMTHIPSTIPILMLGGQRDEVVPSSHMRSLWRAANPVQHTNEMPRNGKFVELPEGGHNDSWTQPGYWEAVAHFIEGVLLTPNT